MGRGDRGWEMEEWSGIREYYAWEIDGYFGMHASLDKVGYQREHGCNTGKNDCRPEMAPEVVGKVFVIFDL